jgi:hypothetical protein
MSDEKAPEQTDITKLSLIQLKALVYDQLFILEQTQNNLNVLRQEIAKRQE